MILEGGFLLAGYVILKTAFVLINESEVNFNVPRLYQRLSFGAMAMVMQVMFF